MNTLFPFGFSGATTFYLIVYVVTLLMHVVFMNYVLAGVTWLFCSGWLERRLSPPYTSDDAASSADPWSPLLRDWLPFATGLTITAGVAPLLFLQILYRRQFYTANLLLSHRWMFILPVLLICFYLLYLQKSHWLSRRGIWLHHVVRTGIWLGFGFIAWSWTENHLLSLNESVWPEMYARSELIYRTSLLPSRLATWYLGAFPTWACLLLWQVAWTPRLPVPLTDRWLRILAGVALGGLVAAGLTAVWHAVSLPAELRSGLLNQFCGPYVALAAIGGVLQLAGWGMVIRAGTTTTGLRWLITTGCALTLVGMTVAREGIRLGSLSLEAITPGHQDAARIGGLGAFLFFFALNACLIAWCLYRVRQEAFRPPEQQSAKSH